MSACDCGADDCPKCHPGCNEIVPVDCGCGEMVSHNVTSCEWCNRDVCGECGICEECRTKQNEETEI